MCFSWEQARERADQMDLIWSGIQTENSHRRAHVCPQIRWIIVFPTRRGVEAIEAGDYKPIPVPTDGPPYTGLGYLVPPDEIEGRLALKPPRELWDRFPIFRTDSPAEKGRKAHSIVWELVRAGDFPLPLKVECEEVLENTDLQKSGRDITVKGVELALEEAGVEVKCDWPVGGGSDKLFLQIAERNPNGYH